tara:strand:- start:38 stop:463 length:426 start_codon:yes stop_codon:yes gene_type:complete
MDTKKNNNQPKGKKNMTSAKNARFWIQHTISESKYTPVKITLKPGDTFSHGYSYTHDEGWASGGSTYRYDGTTISVSEADECTDCDGRYSSGWLGFCTIESLTDKPNRRWTDEATGQVYVQPAWTETEKEQRDYRAEEAGY